MCTVQDVQIDEAGLQERLANGGTAITQNTPAPTIDATDGNPGSTKTGIAGGGDVGVGPGGGKDGTGETVTPATYTPNSDGSFNGQSYLDAHPDVMAEYNRIMTTADRNSPWFTEHGLDQGAAGFAAWHANNGGYSTSGSSAPGSAGGTTSDTLTGLTTSFNDTIKQLQESTAAQIAALNNNSTNLTAQIADMQKGFATSQQELLDNMNKAAAAQSQSFAKALKDLTGANGQAAKKPNYGKALQRNKDLNGAGIGATMLTGPGGVPAGSASLGTTSLLGAA
jgi:hypothetical protein